MQYEAGQKVRIVSKRTSKMDSNGGMDKYLDTVMTIDKISITTYRMEEDNGKWWWTDDMIAGLA